MKHKRNVELLMSTGDRILGQRSHVKLAISSVMGGTLQLDLEMSQPEPVRGALSIEGNENNTNQQWLEPKLFY